jgi:hypothetical protein
MTKLFTNFEFVFFNLFLISLFIGYFICHFIVAPILLNKHGKKGIRESIVWEALQAENHLKDLAKETNDKAVITTLRIIKYSKYSMALFFILFLVSGFLFDLN